MSAALQAASLSGHDGQLVVAALVAIAAVVLLISWLKVNPFLALLLGSAVLAAVAGFAPDKAVASFQKGVGDTFGNVGILVALGAIVGRMLVDSGGAAAVVDSIVQRVPERALPWAMAGAAALIGLPLFFEIGVVLLIPIVLLVAYRTSIPLLKVGIPALAGLSALHGFVPPHPGPLIAIAALKADLGLTLGLGLLLAIPAVILAGPVYGSIIAPYGPARPPRGSAGGVVDEDEEVGGSGRRTTAAGTADAAETTDVATEERTTTSTRTGRRPSVGWTLATVLLPVVLMLGRAVGELTLDDDSTARSVLDVVGTPVIALLAGTILAIFALGVAVGKNRGDIAGSVDASLPPMAGTLLIIAAGGGFKQTLVDSGVGGLIGRLAEGANMNVILLGWLVAVGIRLATGSATVSTITAAGIVAPLASSLDKPGVSCLVLAIGAGSLFFSHVNDVGFWLIKQYFGMTVWETIKSWSVMETIISVVGLLGALLLNAVL
ncbi:gluconate:H+ symporter [Angustibacter peucedani]